MEDEFIESMVLFRQEAGEEWKLPRTLDGEARRKALEAIADWQRENV